MPNLADGNAKYRVTNSGKRVQVVGSHVFPGVGDNGKPSTKTAELTPQQHLQARARNGLDVKGAGGTAKKS